MSQNPFGPLSDEEIQAAINAPFGGAADILRKHDPMWGKFLSTGDKIRWKVTLHQQVTMQATTYVEAETEEEAEELAAMIDSAKLTFDTFVDSDDGEVIEAVPA
jgi:hypothetical protein